MSTVSESFGQASSKTCELALAIWDHRRTVLSDFGSFMNLNVGRRPSLSVSDFNIDLPEISPAEDLVSWYDHKSRLQPGLSGPPGWISTAFHWSAKLALIASDVYHSM
jgi:hypothetical protein